VGEVFAALIRPAGCSVWPGGVSLRAERRGLVVLVVHRSLRGPPPAQRRRCICGVRLF